jgi:hypothetical protein
MTVFVEPFPEGADMVGLVDVKTSRTWGRYWTTSLSFAPVIGDVIRGADHIEKQEMSAVPFDDSQ